MVLAVIAGPWLASRPAAAAELQLVPGLAVVARCPAKTGTGKTVQPRFTAGTLYCEYDVDVAPQCPTTHTKYLAGPGQDRCHKVGQIATGPNTTATITLNESVAVSCPAGYSLNVDPGSPYMAPSPVDRCIGKKTVAPVLRNP